MTTSYTKKQEAQQEEDPAKQAALTFLMTPLATVVKEQWEENQLYDGLVVQLRDRGITTIADLFWHGEQWFMSPERGWLHANDRSIILRTMCEVRITFGSDHHPIVLLNEHREQLGLKPLHHHMGKDDREMVTMHPIYP